MNARFGLALFFLAALPGLGAEPPTPATAVAPAEREVAVHLTDGSTLIGRIVSEDERRLKVVTRSGVEVEVERRLVASIDDASKAAPAAEPEPVLDETRLFLAPTGRPLRKGSGYFSDHLIFLPGVAYGVTDNITLAGGVSVVPGLGFDEQAIFFTPKVGARFGDRAAVSVGGLYMRAGVGDDGGHVSIGYAVGTWGTPEHSLTAGIGLGQAGDNDDYDRYDDDSARPMLMIGGATRLSKRLSLISENWIFPDGDFQLLSAGLRFRGDRLTVDLAFFTFEELIDEGGLPAVPWLSFSYHFSPPRSRK